MNEFDVGSSRSAPPTTVIPARGETSDSTLPKSLDCNVSPSGRERALARKTSVAPASGFPPLDWAPRGRYSVGFSHFVSPHPATWFAARAKTKSKSPRRFR